MTQGAPGPQTGAQGSFVQIQATGEGQNGPGPQAIPHSGTGGRPGQERPKNLLSQPCGIDCGVQSRTEITKHRRGSKDGAREEETQEKVLMKQEEENQEKGKHRGAELTKKEKK